MLRSLGDIACDIGVVGLAVWAAKISLWLTPLAVLLIGNRQRSLGNILHDGSHGSLHPSRGVNDLILRVLERHQVPQRPLSSSRSAGRCKQGPGLHLATAWN
jgi:fatty acid desaturase